MNAGAWTLLQFDGLDRLADAAGGELVLFFLIGLLGGAHCIGMCGPLVTIYAGRMDERISEPGERLTVFEVRQHGLFNLGRAASYTAIGAAFGALGGLFYLTTGTLTGITDAIRGSVGIVVGLVVIAIGVYYLVGRAAPGLHLGIGGNRLVAALTTRLDRLASGPGIVGLGSLHGLLPCPILYPAYLYAFAAGSATSGGLALAALGLGTIPAVFLYGTLIEAVGPTRRRQLHRVLGAAFILLGYIPLQHGLMLYGIHLPHPEIPFYQPLETPGHGH
ncbi:Sulfite exporter TauE/SafE [Halalkaliarchaeum sp. AArc-CO]|uniref:sulfite exporter TauE/SafE family protein n=1 Tax=unclassified Halalkaliarchaeum TaxID=2678344 RepID=UPI00217E15E4|nr:MULTISPECIES: sulfite exporter TauE/SafE family protein [unclassified Halalkaliarchaeum]MDR5673959.1 sulfite exporter TauE/SafE family protein [Halalkaliarchaeum sp. AArc-GB]UWG50595.1 Sulfite exporter TauE/SafE [Halalkaliarchaeum sp. AArc-CO]